MSDHERRYVRQPKPESRIDIVRSYYAYRDGKSHGVIPLTHDRKRDFEAKGWTFKEARGMRTT